MNIPFAPKRNNNMTNGEVKGDHNLNTPMPRVVRARALDEQNVTERDATALASVEAALAPDLRPMPNSSDQVVQSFIDMGKNIATAMRKAGDACEEQGKRRKDEYYKAAEVAERKGEFQAREAGEFIDSILAINTAVASKLPNVPVPNVEASKPSGE